jgi:hypothetical protein
MLTIEPAPPCAGYLMGVWIKSPWRGDWHPCSTRQASQPGSRGAAVRLAGRCRVTLRCFGAAGMRMTGGGDA